MHQSSLRRCDARCVEIDLERTVPPGSSADERLAADARRRRRADGRDKPPASDTGRTACARTWRQRGRCSARCRRSADRCRADRQRHRRGRIRARLGRRLAPRAERIGALARRAGRRRQPTSGPCSVTVPGAVRLWADLAARFGRLGLDAAVGPAADLAGEWSGLHGAHRSQVGADAEHAPCSAPVLGGRYCAARARAHAAAGSPSEGPEALYEGQVAAAIAAATWLSEDDLAAHRSEWVEPLRRAYRGVEVCELPPNGQGAAALLALALYDGLEPGLHSQIEAMKIALADTRAVVHDGPLPDDFFADERLAARRALVRPDAAARPATRRPRGGTTYLCVVDGRRDGGVVDPERLRLVRLGRRRGGNGHRAAEPRRRLQRRPGASERARARHAAVPHDHPGHAARGRRPARPVRRDGWRDAAAGPFPGRPPPRRPRRRSAGGARRAALAGGGGRVVELEPGLWHRDGACSSSGTTPARGETSNTVSGSAR